LGLEHFALQGVHAGGGFVDLAGEGEGALEDGEKLLLVLDAGGGVFVFDDEGAGGEVEFCR
jgi:hypothetical protein